MNPAISIVLLCSLWASTDAREFSLESSIAAVKALRAYGHSFYDLATNATLQGRLTVLQGLKNSAMPQLLKIEFDGTRNECKCEALECKCCVGFNLTTVQFERHLCADFAYNGTADAINLDVSLNDNELYSSALSAKNPPAACWSIPYLPIVNLCLRLSDLDISRANQTMHTCVDVEVRIFASVLLIHHFDCVDFSNDGLSWSKPQILADDRNRTEIFQFSPFQQPTTAQPSVDKGQTSESTTEPSATEFHDPVEFETAAPQLDDGEKFVTTTLSPEEEDKIGSHRVP